MQLEDKPACAVEECERRAKTRGWCQKHYMRWRANGDPLVVKPTGHSRDHDVCSIPDCLNVPVARGWCSPHYHRWQRHGDPVFQTKTWRKENCRHGHTDWSPTRMQLHRNGSVYPVRYCLTCHKEWRKTPAARRAKARNARKYVYGIKPYEFEALLGAQGGKCAICRQPPVRPSVDHDHETGTIRGILCGPCNIAIGLLQDSPDVLQAAAAYVTNHGWSRR